jgi:hypothetical protein
MLNILRSESDTLNNYILIRKKYLRNGRIIVPYLFAGSVTEVTSNYRNIGLSMLLNTHYDLSKILSQVSLHMKK